jgi:hypothetical protein
MKFSLQQQHKCKCIMETAKFWTSSWLNDVSPAAMFPNLYKHSRRKNKSVAYAMANDNWIRDIMHDITTELMTQYILLWELIRQQNSMVKTRKWM